ncbi:putative leucyl aminopeptidase [Burkholderia thailandensis 34]|uniref:leucyl aminopeptidase (aminopeptidase T) n=1 Tax=Burkholderia thailandensis TaxID=57975 RepID=UPI0005D8E170|nr:leucyl aminopeptidase (aminopeptidase T) [Burkholderia thailandensis]AJY32027.1 putative leucyl aminopeptidase [Burkholderia thailandensis 34]AOJ60405.1 leucyl aminopeptidase [Burkholderia thailandensis]KXF57396.1 leucyl aminopeptidase [Burkholderia thailandensis]PNE77866.1 leucyl aminopeptidase [Burkholderia thailandensis]
MQNLHRALGFHPALRDKLARANTGNLLVGYDAANRDIALQAFSELPESLDATPLCLESTAPADIIAAIGRSDLFVLLYDSSCLPTPSPSGPPFLSAIRPAIVEHWGKSVLFKDYGPHLDEAFSESLDDIAARNARLIDAAGRASQVNFVDEAGNLLTGSLKPARKWTSVDGMGNLDVVPGEIATHVTDLRGSIVFSGTFLSTIPFAVKYKVVERLATLHIEGSAIVGFDSDHPGFRHDFASYLERHANHRRIEEFGIGTNLGIKGLYGRNAGFEERHPGLHLGLGGGEQGSHHLDLIFAKGTLAFDDRIVFDRAFTV